MARLLPSAVSSSASIAKKTGRSVADVLKAALTAHALAICVLPPAATSSEERFNAMSAIARRAAQRPVFEERSPDEIIGYRMPIAVPRQDGEQQVPDLTLRWREPRLKRKE